jgi:hypothetical protein
MFDAVSESEFRVRYPLKAFAAYAGAGLLFLTTLAFGAFFCILLLPLVPALVGMVVANAGLLASAHEYAQSVARLEPRASKLRGPHAQAVPKATLAARSA